MQLLQSLNATVSNTLQATKNRMWYGIVAVHITDTAPCIVVLVCVWYNDLYLSLFQERGAQFKQARSDYITSITNSSSSSSSSPIPPLNSHPSQRLQPQPQPQKALLQKHIPHTQPQHSALAPAALWCSPKSAQDFVTQMQKSMSSANCLNLAPGERVLVQVPTSLQASAIIWEFATDQGSVGFGLKFERNVEVQVSVQQLLPVTPRDCAVDLVLGKHQYQDQGTYLLEFVNTLSTRPKIVYYRVLYQNNVTSR